MTFEQALESASREYLKRKEKGLSPADVAALFEKYLHVIEASSYEGGDTITLPGPGLWELYYVGSADSHHWAYNANNARLQRRREKWPEGSGKDGIITLEFNHFDKPAGRHAKGVLINFDPYLLIPNNRLERPGLVSPPDRPAQDLANLVWVYDKNGIRTSEELTNWSDHGRIRHIWTEGYASFRRAPTEQDQQPDDIPELVMWLPGEGRAVRSIIPWIPSGASSGVESIRFDNYNVAPLGGGSVTAFLKHMNYATQMDRLVR